jgi:hypothetical protein
MAIKIIDLNMKQVYEHYKKWEDYQNGMYCLTVLRDEKQVMQAKKILSNPKLFNSILDKLIVSWPISSAVNLTNKSINRRAWLGAAACSFQYGVTEVNTRNAWSELNDLQRFNANTVAEIIIKKYEEQNTGLYPNMGKPMLF